MANIKKYTDNIRKAIYGKEVRGSIADGIEAINNEVEDNTEIAVNVEQRQDAVEQQFDDLQQNYTEGSPSTSEIVAARTNAKTNKNYNTIGRRLDDEYGNVTQQLAETKMNLFYNKITNHKKPKQMLVIIDDDGAKALYTKIFPVLQELNIPITSALITSGVDNADESSFVITKEQYIEMRDSGLVEFIGHSAKDYTQIPLEEVEQDLLQTKLWLLENGGNPDHFVVAYGKDNPEVKELIKKYYKTNFKTFTSGYVLTPPLNMYSIRRIEFESSTTTIKNAMEQAVSMNGLLIINTHANYTTFTQEKFRELILYAQSIGMEITTAGKAIEHFGNLLEGDSNPNNRQLYSGIDANGLPFGLLDGKYYEIDATNVKFDTPITDDKFLRGTTIAVFSSALASQYGWPSAEMLKTTKVSANYSYQQYIMYQQHNSILHRFWTGTGWSDFRNIASDQQFRIIDSANVTKDTPASFFERGISSNFYTSSLASANNMPSAGTLFTHKIGGNDFAFQLFYYLTSATVLHRRWTGSGWSGWVNISGNESATSGQINNMSGQVIGQYVFNRTLQRPVWWNGTSWVFADGTAM